MSVCCECCVLSGRGLCDELITRPEESYRLWCVVCGLENTPLVNEEEGQGPLGGYRAPPKKFVTDVSNSYRLQVFSLPVLPNFLQGKDFNQC